jgi:hypothetical protein
MIQDYETAIEMKCHHPGERAFGRDFGDGYVRCGLESHPFTI